MFIHLYVFTILNVYFVIIVFTKNVVIRIALFNLKISKSIIKFKSTRFIKSICLKKSI